MTGIPPVRSALGDAPPTVPTPPPERSVARSMAWLTSSSLVQQVSAFVLTIVVRGILGPAKTGVWNLVQVWQDQILNLTLGPHWVADREMPMLRAQGRHDEEDEVRGITFTYLMVEAGVLAVGFWIYWLFARDGLSPDERLGLALVPLLSMLNTVQFAYQLFIKNRKAFDVFAWTNIAATALDWTIVVYVLVGGLDLLLIGLVATAAVRALGYVVIVRRLRLFRIKPRLSRRLLGPMLTLGIPLSLWNLGSSLMLRLDSLVVGTALGTTALGLYYLGPQVAAGLAAIPTALSVISFPNMMESYGRNGAAALRPHLRDYMSTTMLIVAPVTAAAGVFGLDVLVNVFLPEFRAGLPAMHIAVLTVIFWQPGAFLVQVLTALKRMRLLIGTTFAALAAQGAVLAAGALSGLTLEWAAASAVTGQAAFLVLGSAACCRALAIEREEVMGFWIRLPFAGAAFAGLALLIEHVPPHSSATLAAFGIAALKIAVYVAVALVVTLATDRTAFRRGRALLRGSGKV